MLRAARRVGLVDARRAASRSPSAICDLGVRDRLRDHLLERELRRRRRPRGRSARPAARRRGVRMRPSCTPRRAGPVRACSASRVAEHQQLGRALDRAALVVVDRDRPGRRATRRCPSRLSRRRAAGSGRDRARSLGRHLGGRRARSVNVQDPAHAVVALDREDVRRRRSASIVHVSAESLPSPDVSRSFAITATAVAARAPRSVPSACRRRTCRPARCRRAARRACRTRASAPWLLVSSTPSSRRRQRRASRVTTTRPSRSSAHSTLAVGASCALGADREPAVAEPREALGVDAIGHAVERMRLVVAAVPAQRDLDERAVALGDRPQVAVIVDRQIGHAGRRLELDLVEQRRAAASRSSRRACRTPRRRARRPRSASCGAQDHARDLERREQAHRWAPVAAAAGHVELRVAELVAPGEQAALLELARCSATARSGRRGCDRRAGDRRRDIAARRTWRGWCASSTSARPDRGRRSRRARSSPWPG